MFEADELPGFEKITRRLAPGDDGPLVATLVRRQVNVPQARPAVLYLHGFVDYFFQVHVADAFEAAGYRFYALDLRRFGRSIRPGNRCCMSWRISDYYEEIDWALDVIGDAHPRVASIVAHSTGGLIASLYLADRLPQKVARSLVLTSPFLRFNLSPPNLGLSWAVARVARYRPDYRLPQTLRGAYGKTLHKSAQGEWDYDLKKKPLEGFPLYAGWFRMIRAAHARVERGLPLTLPILSLLSDKSRISGHDPVAADFEADLVLNVRHMKTLSPLLGSSVTVQEIPGAVHDITLSRRLVRDAAISSMISFIREHDQ